MNHAGYILSITRRIAGEDTKNGITRSHARRQADTAVGNFPPLARLERIQSNLGRRGVERAQRRGQKLAVLSAGKVEAVSDQATQVCRSLHIDAARI